MGAGASAALPSDAAARAPDNITQEQIDEYMITLSRIGGGLRLGDQTFSGSDARHINRYGGELREGHVLSLRHGGGLRVGQVLSLGDMTFQDAGNTTSTMFVECLGDDTTDDEGGSSEANSPRFDSHPLLHSHPLLCVTASPSSVPDPSDGVRRHIPDDFPGMDAKGVACKGLGTAKMLAVIRRLYNLRQGVPDPQLTSKDQVAKLKQLADNEPVFRGAAPSSHPYPWLFDNKKDTHTMAYTVDHLRQDEPFCRNLDAEVVRFEGHVQSAIRTLGDTPLDVYALGLLEVDQAAIKDAGVYYLVTRASYMDLNRSGSVVHDRCIIYTSSWIQHLTGYTPSDFIGRDCRFLQGPGTDPTAVATIGRALGRGDNVQVIILNYRKDGSPFWNLLSITPLRNREQDVVAFLGVQKDVTDLVRFYLDRVAAASAKMASIKFATVSNAQSGRWCALCAMDCPLGVLGGGGEEGAHSCTHSSGGGARGDRGDGGGGRKDESEEGEEDIITSLFSEAVEMSNSDSV